MEALDPVDGEEKAKTFAALDNDLPKVLQLSFRESQ